MNHNHHNEGEGKSPPANAEKSLLEASIDLEAFDARGRSNLVNRLTSREMDSLTAISDTLLPSIDVPAGTHNESIRTFYLTSASMLGIPETLGGYVSGRMQHALLWLLRLSLWLLSTWYGTFILCGTKSMSGRFPYFHKLSDVDPQRREEIMLSWSLSFFYIHRQLFRALKILVALFYFTQVNEKNENPTWQALGYCGPDPELVSTRDKSVTKYEQKAQERIGPLHRGLVYMESTRDTLSSALAQAGLRLTTRPHRGQPKPIRTIQCDAVVIGSGSGGGVVAGVLAQAGYKVVVLEKGGYHTRSNLTLLEGQAMDQMYEGGGLLATEDMGLIILSGSTVGGGSAINWSASLRTPDHVIREWRHEHGLELFGSDAYAEAMDAVCERMGVQPDVHDESLNNAALRKGCVELGYPVHNIPRNTPPDHYCGWCCFGCKDGRKKGTSETWLVDMTESGNGVILPGCKAIKVLHKDKGRKRNVATGVLFEFENGWTGEKETCIIEAKATVVACGALGTPVLLKRSGLRNPNIGKHLHLHPVVMVWGYFPETSWWSEKEEDGYKNKTSYEGGIMTAMSTVLSNSATTGYGAVIQTPALHPGMFSAVTPWLSGADFKDRMTRYSRTSHAFALARDKGSGEVKESGSIGYHMERTDEENLKKGVEKMLRIMAAAGAAEIGITHGSGERLDVTKASSHEFERFVRAASRRGMRDLSTPICSAHQMGSCRMGVHPKTSAVDPRGESWEVEGLYVADSSVFPTALGVNPMVTIQATAYCTAQTVLEVLRRKTKKNETKSNKRTGIEAKNIT